MRLRSTLCAPLLGLALAAACGASDDLPTYALASGKADLWVDQTIHIPAGQDGAPGVLAFEVLTDASFQCVVSDPGRRAPLALVVDGAVLASTEDGTLDVRVVVSGPRYRSLRVELHNFAKVALTARLALQPPRAPLASLTCSDAAGQPCDLTTHDCIKGKAPTQGGSWPAFCEPKTRDGAGRETCAYTDGVRPGYLFRQCNCNGAQYCVPAGRWSSTCDATKQYFACNASAFCDDVSAKLLLARLEGALKRHDGATLATLVATDGLRLRRSWWAPEVVIPQQDVAALLGSDATYDWGVADGSGEPIVGRFADVMLPLLDADLLGASEQACNALLAGPTAGLVQLPEGYDALGHFSYLRTATDDLGFDWGSWAVGLKKQGTRYAVSYLVHYAWEI